MWSLFCDRQRENKDACAGEEDRGETMACGTGACAAVVSSIMRNYVDNCVEVNMEGGNIFIEGKKENGHIYMTGEAKTVFEGEIDVCSL